MILLLFLRPVEISRLPESIWRQNNSIRGKFTNSRGVNNPPEHFVNKQVLTAHIGLYIFKRIEFVQFL